MNTASVRRQPSVAGRDLHAFVDGELDGEGYRAVVARLAADPDAAERVGDLLRQRGALLALREQLDDVDPLQDERTEALARGLADAVRRRRRVRRGLASSGLALTLAVGLWGVSRYLPPVLALLPVVIGAAFLIERRLSARQVAVGLQPAAAILLRHLPPARRVIR